MNLEKLLYRILLGYYPIIIDNIEYRVIYPTVDIKYKAEILYDNIIEDNKFDKRLLTPEEISSYLISNNIWKPSDEAILEKSKKFLEDTKIDLYVNYMNEKKRKQLKKQLSTITKDIVTLTNNKNSMNYLGINDHAMAIKNEFIIMNTVYCNNDLVFKNNENNYEYQKLQIFIRAILEQSIDLIQLRELAKSELWKSLYPCINITKNINEINDDYKYLINLHRMYESVRQHPECPSEDIINDDDALDGWFLFNNRKAEQEKKKNAVMNKIGGNIKNAGEIFLITDDIKETKEIYDLNDTTSKHNIREMISTAHQAEQNQKQSVQWTDLPFVKRELQQQISNINDSRKKG